MSQSDNARELARGIKKVLSLAVLDQYGVDTEQELRKALNDYNETEQNGCSEG